MSQTFCLCHLSYLVSFILVTPLPMHCLNAFWHCHPYIYSHFLKCFLYLYLYLFELGEYSKIHNLLLLTAPLLALHNCISI